ncbi:ATP-binding protein [Pseudophaeobacter sp.]|uniref:AAA family ATPase n=1 Tax=Pseudophaeobacter sp. TaxID=1971739 RepID=UPI00329A5D0B
MTSSKPKLHVICGRIAAGKSTLAARLSEPAHIVCISEDDWLSALYGTQMQTVQDYVKFSAKLREVMTPHISQLLKAGLSVVLDYHANTIENRRWMRECAAQAGAEVLLHLLEVDEETCWQRLLDRNARREHPFQPSRAQFIQICKHYAPPQPQEGFAIQIHRAG